MAPNNNNNIDDNNCSHCDSHYFIISIFLTHNSKSHDDKHLKLRVLLSVAPPVVQKQYCITVSCVVLQYFQTVAAQKLLISVNVSDKLHVH